MKESDINIAISKIRGLETHWPNGVVKLNLPRFCSDLNLWRPIFDDLAKFGWHCDCNMFPSGRWDVIIFNNSNDFNGVADTFIMALCEAFLRMHNKWRE